MKITVVYDSKTKKIYPHAYGKDGEIIITSSGIMNEDNLIVSKIDIRYIDTLNWYVLDDENKDRSNL